ncbi:hypothetical protein K4F52_009273 [Lecanicillium sp. MT-2017a]|nr:hypothetical protein K4F52_009273 [Lecanicillium sp. MT-2017a]
MFILFTTALFFIVTATALFFTRSYWRQHVPELNIRLPSVRFPGAEYLYSRLPTTFAGDIEAGLSSTTFDLSGNVEDGDSRAGLDAQSKAEILKIMKKKRMTFDQARKAYMEGRFKANGIGPDGRPRDPKFVSFS